MLAEAAPYAPIAVLTIAAILLAAVIMVLAHTVGPRRHGPVKDIPYESGVNPVGDARKRFNVGFYLAAMLFLLFDVEILFLYPAVPLFAQAGQSSDRSLIAFFGVELLVFFAILAIGWYYERKKGVI